MTSLEERVVGNDRSRTERRTRGPSRKTGVGDEGGRAAQGSAGCTEMDPAGEGCGSLQRKRHRLPIAAYSYWASPSIDRQQCMCGVLAPALGLRTWRLFSAFGAGVD